MARNRPVRPRDLTVAGNMTPPDGAGIIFLGRMEKKRRKIGPGNTAAPDDGGPRVAN